VPREAGSRTFNELFLKAVERGLGKLGESPKMAILYHLEQRYSIKKDELYDKLEELSRALKEMFGFGALVIEEFIARELYALLGLSFHEKKNYRLADYIRELKEQGRC